MDIRKFRIIFGGFFTIFGLIVLYVSATTTLRCDRDESSGTSCRLTRQVLRRIPIQDTLIGRLDGAREDTRLSRPSINSRSRATRAADRVVLLTDRGDLPLSNYGARDTSTTVDQINKFVQDTSQRSLVIRHEFAEAGLGNIAGSCMLLPVLIAIPSALVRLVRGRPSRPSAARRKRGSKRVT